MRRPYSNDLRERVVSAAASGEPVRTVASRFGVSVSSAVKWHQRYRATDSVKPDKMGAKHTFVLDAHRAFILEAITSTPHLTVRALQALLADRGIKVSHHAA